jgi:hypothetical protein
MISYIPGTTETDPKKQNRAIQQLGISVQKAQADIATNTSAISALQDGPLTSGNVASKSDQQTGTSAVLAVTPAHQQDHDSAAKAWVVFDSSANILAAYNVSGVTKNSTGIFTINFSVSFSSTDYACLVTTEASGNNGWGQVQSGGRSAGSVKIGCIDQVPAVFDPTSVSVVCYGRQ